MIPFHPCGCVVDFIRHGYTTRMKLWADSDELTSVRWFFARPGATWLPGLHGFTSAIWDRVSVVPADTPDYDGPGEPWPAPFRIAKGNDPIGYLGKAPHGDIAVTLRGGIHGVDPEFTTIAGGAIAGCARAQQIGGGDGHGGQAQLGTGYLVWQGGQVQGGQATGLVGLLLATGGECQGGEGMALITITTETGSPSFSGISTLELDSEAGVLTQPGAGHARYLARPADAIHPGIVSLAPQSMGAGAKFFSDKIGVGTVLPLSDVALDVRGYDGVNIAGAVFFGGGNFLTSTVDAAILAWNSTTPFDLECLVGLPAQGAGHMIGWRVNPVSCKMQLLYRSPGVPALTFLNTDTSAETPVGGSSNASLVALEWMS